MWVRPMEEQDISAVAEMEKSCFDDAWNENMIKDMFANNFDKVFIAEDEGKAAGYINLRVLADEGELMRICVVPEFRRRGLANLMMERAVSAQAKADKLNRIFLEVRDSNISAQELYKKFGFKEISRRAKYYSNPDEDAIVMEK